MTVGRTYNQLDERLQGWIADQRMFFVATAPSGPAGRVNLSPKGHADTFALLDGRTVAYLNLTGSGAETVAHLGDNGRITLKFCAFSGPPRRSCHCRGRGRAHRRLLRVRGPLYDYAGERDLLDQWAGQGRRRPGRLPRPAQPPEHRRPPGSAHGRQCPAGGLGLRAG
jgi:hypothetical protein